MPFMKKRLRVLCWILLVLDKAELETPINVFIQTTIKLELINKTVETTSHANQNWEFLSYFKCSEEGEDRAVLTTC